MADSEKSSGQKQNSPVQYISFLEVVPYELSFL
jgi:hypothetical protein